MYAIVKIVLVMLAVGMSVGAAYLWVLFLLVPDDKLRSRLQLACAFVFALGVAMLLLVSIAKAEEPYHSNPWLLSWIPATCCVTNDCCWEVSERELRSLPDDEWEVRSTGQVRKRTGWSPDGKFYRCACDYDNKEKHWVKHQGANTRCLFIPMRSAKVLPK